MQQQSIEAGPGGRLPETFEAGRRLALSGVFGVAGASLDFERNAEIFGEGEPADYVYRVVGGAVRTYRLLNDGRRQISAFLLPGDVFGLDSAEIHGLTAEAVVDSKVEFVRRTALVAIAARDGEIANQLWRLATGELRRAREHVLLLGRKSARERIASFLLDMARRAVAGDTVELPMTRLDIADYLGLTIETVSRTLTLLESAATIELSGARRIRLRDRMALSRLDS